MLDGTFFYVDRLEGRAYCDQCVPSHGGRAAGWLGAARRGARWLMVRSGDAQVRSVGREGTVRSFVLRCATCGALQPPAA